MPIYCAPGDRVSFRPAKGEGSAVVLRTRLLSNTVEAGFQITCGRPASNCFQVVREPKDFFDRTLG
jgi:hypothetical protein